MAQMIQIKIKGWNLLPMPVRQGVSNHLKSLELPWQISNSSDPAIGFGDILMEVLLDGYVSWKEQVKVYLGSLIYAFHHAYLTGDTACWEMAANMGPPSKTATGETKPAGKGRSGSGLEKAAIKEKKRLRKGLPVIDD